MKPLRTMIGIAILAASIPAAQSLSQEALALKNGQDRDNYAIGIEIVRKLKQQGGEVNLDIVIKGMKDELRDSRLITEEELQTLTAARRKGDMHKQNQAVAADINSAAKDAAVAEAATGTLTPAVETGATARSETADQPGSIAPSKTGRSVAELNRSQSIVKRRADILRQRTIMQERGGV